MKDTICAIGTLVGESSINLIRISGSESINIVNKIFDKGKAVIKVCEYMGIDIKDSIGFGDSMNDLEMIQQVGYSVVMENGSDPLKKLANYVAPKVTEDGLYLAFEKLELI